MYAQTETTDKFKSRSSGEELHPVATLKDESGGECQIVKDDHSYVIYLKMKDGNYEPTVHIFKEVFDVLKTLDSPE